MATCRRSAVSLLLSVAVIEMVSQPAVGPVKVSVARSALTVLSEPVIDRVLPPFDATPPVAARMPVASLSVTVKVSPLVGAGSTRMTPPTDRDCPTPDVARFGAVIE